MSYKKITPEKKEELIRGLNFLLECGYSVAVAAEKLSISRRTAFRWLEEERIKEEERAKIRKESENVRPWLRKSRANWLLRFSKPTGFRSQCADLLRRLANLFDGAEP